ncbi:MAG: PepSY domain-containing protein [Candidatus Omnitrophica bacterium]|nr:hypothetical protein [bacterium]NUN96789.1 PepSY domain-containing protein [Candidatus Omnitrophota bacterium]
MAFRIPTIRHGFAVFLLLSVALSLCMCAFPPIACMAAEEEEVAVTLDQLPAAVKQTIEKETAGGTITELVKEIEDGKTIYEAEFTKDGKAFEVEVAEDGTLLAKEAGDEEDEDEEGDDEEEGDEEGEFKLTFDRMSLGKITEGCRIAETHGKGTKAKWEVIEMEGAPSGKRVFAVVETKNSGETFNLAYADGGTVKDLELSVKLKAISGQEDQGGGLVWRLKDENNYYLARWNPLENNFRVYSVSGGERKQLGGVDIVADPQAWHEIEITMSGNKIVAEFDGKKYITIEDDTLPNAGTIGLWTKADAATAFDDLEIEEVRAGAGK